MMLVVNARRTVQRLFCASLMFWALYIVLKKVHCAVDAKWDVLWMKLIFSGWGWILISPRDFFETKYKCHPSVFFHTFFHFLTPSHALNGRTCASAAMMLETPNEIRDKWEWISLDQLKGQVLWKGSCNICSAWHSYAFLISWCWQALAKIREWTCSAISTLLTSCWRKMQTK